MSRIRHGRTWRRDPHGESGAIAVMAAVLLLALVLSVSLAVDVGRVAAASRDLQGATDRAALDGVKLLRDAYRPDGSVDDALLGDVRAEVAASLVQNGFPETRLDDVTVVLGRVEPGSTAFVPVLPLGPTTPSPVPEPNAVQVSTSRFESFVLALGDAEGGRDLHKTAAAAADAIGSVSAGTTTASIGDDAGVVNALLGRLLGGGASVGLDVIGYEGMAGTRVELGPLAAALGAGSIDELLDTEVTLAGLFGGMIAAIEASALEAEGGSVDAAVGALGALSAAGGTGSLPPVRLGEVLDLDTSGTAGAEAGVDAFSLAMAALMLANASGDPAADCDGPHGLTLDLGVPGVTEACLNIVEPPVIAIGPARHDDDGWRTVASTAQIRLDLTLPVTGELGLGDDEDGLGLEVTTGGGTAALTGTQCAGEGAVETSVTTSTAEVTLAPVSLTLLDDLGLADLVDLLDPFGLLDPLETSVELGGTLSVGSGSGASDFAGPFPAEGTRVSADGLGLGELLTANLPDLVSLDSPLLDLLGLDDLVDALLGELSPVVGALDGEVDTLLDVLGMELGAVDVRALDLDCDGRRLLPLDRSS